MLDTIIEALSGIDSNVQKGIPRKIGDTWDSIVVKKDRWNMERASKTMYVSVRIVREDEIEDGLETQVIQAMRGIGWRLGGDDIRYEYAVDQNEVVVEICTMQFYDPSKRCGNV